MRTHMKWGIGLLVVAAALWVVAPGATGAITNSAHDFSGDSWNTDGEICEACHTPHNADTTVTNAPLWNHDVTTATFTLYTSSTLNATMAPPGGVSKLCLSCHDGTVALDSFGGASGGTNITGGELIGTDLTEHHPVAFTYNSTLATADGELFNPSTANSGLGGTIAADMLFSNTMECASCHDVHNTANQSNLLVKSNSGSALCLTCHDK